MKQEGINYLAVEKYAAPVIEVIDIELTHNILSGSFELPPVGDGEDAW